MEIFKLFGIIDINGEAAIKAIEDVAKKAGDAEKKMQDWQKTAVSVGKGLMAAGATIIGGMSAILVSTTNASSEIDKLAKQTGRSREELQALGYAAQQEHASLAGLATGLNRLSRNMLDAAAGTGEAKDAFAALGISLVDANGNLRSSTDVLLDVADLFSQMTNETEMTAVAMKLFGRSGAELVPFLRLGGAEIQRLSQEARDLGFVMGEQSVKDLKKFDDQLTAIRAGFAGAGRQIAVDLLPYAQQLSEWLTDAVKWFNSLPEPVRRTATVATALGGALALVAGPMLLIIGYIPQIMTGLGMLSGAFTPFLVGGAIVAGLAAIVTMFVQMKENARLAKLEIASISELAEAEKARQYWASEVERLEKAKATGGVRPQKMSAAAYGFLAGSMGSPEYGVGAPPQALEGVIGIDQAELDNAKKKLTEATAKVQELKKAQDDAASSSGNLNVTVTGVGETTRTVADVLKDMDKALAAAAEKEKLLGDQFDLDAEKAKIYSSAIDELIALGLKASDPRLQEVFRKWIQLQPDEVSQALDTVREYATRQYQALLAEQAEYRRKESEANDERIRTRLKAEQELEDSIRQLKQKAENETRQMLADDSRQYEEWRRQEANKTADELIAAAERCRDEELATYIERLRTALTTYEAMGDAGVDMYARILVALNTLTERQQTTRAEDIAQYRADQAEVAQDWKEYQDWKERERARELQQTSADQRSVAEEGKKLAQEVANTAQFEHERLMGQITQDARDLEAEGKRQIETLGEIARAKWQDTVAMMVKGARDFEQDSREEQERQARERARQIEQFGADQRDVQAEGKEYEEWRARQIEETLHEWEQGVKRIQVLDGRAGAAAVAQEGKNYEEWKRQQAKKTADTLIEEAERSKDSEIDAMIEKLEAALITYRAMGDEGVESYARILVALNELKQRQQESVGYHRWKVEQEYGLERNLTEWQKQEIAKRLQAELAALDTSVEANRVRAEAIKGILADLSATMPALEQMTADWSQTLIDGLARAIAYGEDLGDVFKNLLRQIAEWFLKYKVLMPLLGPLFGAGMTPAYAASIGVGAGWGPVTTLPFMHLGGLVEPIRAHSGYLAPDEVPAILQTGERVLSRDQNVALERLLAEPRQVQVEMHIHAVDAASFTALAQRNPEAITSVVIRNIQNNGEIRRVLMGR